VTIILVVVAVPADETVMAPVFVFTAMKAGRAVLSYFFPV
jgi:hypothetical protein